MSRTTFNLMVSHLVYNDNIMKLQGLTSNMITKRSFEILQMQPMSYHCYLCFFLFNNKLNFQFLSRKNQRNSCIDENSDNTYKTLHRNSTIINYANDPKQSAAPARSSLDGVKRVILLGKIFVLGNSFHVPTGGLWQTSTDQCKISSNTLPV